MTLLSPWSALIAAAVAVPMLLLLYILRLRRQRLRVPTTLLWQKSYEDLQANVPFQRLRWSALLLLQLLVLILLILALGEPVMRGEGASASRVVLLIDRSASMNALIDADADQPRTRLDVAKDKAKDIVRQLGRIGQPTQVMIVSFGSSARVVTTFESDRRTLLDAIDSIQPTDERANLDAALQLAGAFALSPNENAADERSQPEVVLLSDGGVGGTGDAAGFSLRAGTFRFIPALDDVLEQPQASNNIGIASFSARRDYENPARVLVFARLVNASDQPIDVVATLAVDDQPVMSVQKTVPAAVEHGPGETTVTHALELPGGAVLTLRHNRRDSLAADDVAALVLPAPSRPRIALVQPGGASQIATGPDAWLRDLLAAMEPQRLDVLSPEAFANLDAHQIDSGSLYELIVFDRVAPARLPGVPTLTIGATPTGVREIPPGSRRDRAPTQDDTAQASDDLGRRVLSWDRRHPLMRHISLDTLVYAGFGAYDLPAGATPLAYGSDGPIIAELRTRGARHVLVGFAMNKSNWPLHVSSAMFMQNVLDDLTVARTGQHGLVAQPGEPITIRASSDAHELVIDGAAQSRIAVVPGEMITLPVLRRVGLYTVQGAAPPNDRIAVSLLSDVESDIRPRTEITVNAEAASASAARAIGYQPLWPWLLGAAFALLVIEWLSYCRRVHG